MKPHQLLIHLRQQGATLWVNGDQLRIQAPKGVLNAELRFSLRQHKPALLKLVQQQQAIPAWSEDLTSEVVLEPSIRPKAISPVSQNPPSAIFLTGATGFLGAFILQELLQRTRANIYCLVRAVDVPSGQKRIQANLQAYGIWGKPDGDRIIPVVGDLGQPYLGLSSQQFQQLAARIDCIYHSGALLNYIYSYPRLRSVNVQGTQEVLRLASCSQTAPVHYISSVAVFDSPAYAQKQILESDPLVYSQGMGLGYSQSKWVAEKLVMMARDRGLPVCIYRVPFISGHSQTGVVNTYDLICRTLKGCLNMGTAPDLDYRLDLAPVDYVSRSIVYLSQQPGARGQAFHLTNPHTYHWHQLIDWMQSQSLGFAVERIAYRDWLERLHRLSSQDNPLVPLRPFFRRRLPGTDLTLPELYQQSRRPQFSCQKTRAALAGAGISCPRIDDQLLRTYFAYFLRTGFLVGGQQPEPEPTLLEKRTA
ncbi:MAG: thioester reductase domain-containing protein [Pleurocapsa sp. MO_226.B13]|nr:thioester reductase domain-containing protein [Pleurocapsa sp. MO_226.B13]